MALPAGAVTVDFHGKALTGVLGSSNDYLLGGEYGDSTIMGVGKVRLRAEVGTDDGRAKMVYGFETGANNFGESDTWEYSGDSKDFENRFAYIQSTLPGMTDNIFARAGLQKTGINQWVWTETAAGLTAYGKGNVNWMTGWFRGLEEDYNSGVHDTDLFVAKGDFSPASGVTIGGFGVYATDFGGKGVYEQEADQFWVGTTGDLSGKVFASGDLVYQGGDAGPGGNQDVSAYLANVTVGTHINDTSKVSFNALYVSGDCDASDSDQEAFQSIDADVKVGQIFFKDSIAASMDRFVDDMFGERQTFDGMRNNGLINFAVEGEMQLDAKNNLRGAVRYLATAEEYAGEDDLGYEFDLWYSYKMNQNLTLKLEGAYLISGDLAEHPDVLNDDDNVYQVGAGAVFAF
ncbi:MAG: hypothetical protein KGY42_01745 [Desulfobacterales bacterium]|nr:hypothetical protein [Desulfobacterales bacterium]MBS3755086.1 hypothetical protein [Desulfobacterales bacterium]